MLPRLPDTRQELTAMAEALDVDPAKVLYLDKDANEQNVETIDLSHVRIIAFATHGLVPGDPGRQHHPIGVELEGENLLHRQQPVARHSGNIRRGQSLNGLTQPALATPRRAQGPARKPLPVSAALFSTPSRNKERLQIAIRN